MKRGSVADVLVPPDRILAVARHIFVALGADEATARAVADALVDADLAGHSSHGVTRIPEYVGEVREQRIDPRAVPETSALAPGARLVDGAWGFGAVAMERAVTSGCELAAAQGIAAVAIVRANHIGRLGRWLESVVAHEQTGLLVASYADGPWEVAPFGGTTPTLTTNPIAFGFPRLGHAPIIADFATAAIAWGKLDLTRRRGQEAPPATIYDARGQPTRDVEAFMQGGAIRTFGKHKGSALSLMVELFACALTASSQRSGGRELAHGALLIVASPELVGESYRETAMRATEITARVTASTPEDNARPVLAPGEFEARARRERASAIPVPKAALDEILALADDLRVDAGGLDVAVRQGTQ